MYFWRTPFAEHRGPLDDDLVISDPVAVQAAALQAVVAVAVANRLVGVRAEDDGDAAVFGFAWPGGFRIRSGTTAPRTLDVGRCPRSTT
jgi:hypothetical protein